MDISLFKLKLLLELIRDRYRWMHMALHLSIHINHLMAIGDSLREMTELDYLLCKYDSIRMSFEWTIHIWSVQTTISNNNWTKIECMFGCPLSILMFEPCSSNVNGLNVRPTLCVHLMNLWFIRLKDRLLFLFS